MALTEQQREIALRVCREFDPSVDEKVVGGILEFATRFLAALPKPEAVAVVDANDDGYWADILPDRGVKVGQLLYTEAPIAQPASAPTGWDAEFLSKRLGRVAKLAGVSIPDRFTHEQVAEAAGTILGQIAAAMKAKTASAPSEQKPDSSLVELLDDAADELESIKETIGYRLTTLEIIKRLRAAIASVKGGA